MLNFLTKTAAALCIMGGVSAVGAQQVGTEKEITMGMLDRSMQKMIRTSPNRAVERLANRMFEMNADGIVSEQTISDYAAGLRALKWANEVEELLAHDLSLDGALDQEELNRAKARLSSHKRAEFELAMIKGDTDLNGRLDWGEVRAFAQDKVDAQHASDMTRRLQTIRQVLVMDMNVDGAVDVAEVARAIHGLNPCRC